MSDKSINPNLLTDHIADYLLVQSRDRGEVLTNLKLQKLLYYAQAWSLALYNKALFEEDFQAWVHGPVLPSQYHRFKSFKWMPIVQQPDMPVILNNVSSHLDEVIDTFGSETAVELELMTHNEAPWQEARAGLDATETCVNPISKSL